MRFLVNYINTIFKVDQKEYQLNPVVYQVIKLIFEKHEEKKNYKYDENIRVNTQKSKNNFQNYLHRKKLFSKFSKISEL